MAEPTVSIIIPFYNVQDCVAYCLDSALAQDFDDYEVVCVDDGSTDDTGKLLDERAATDERLKVVHKENGGLSDARNVGVDVSRGRFISFVDGDDIVSPHYLSSLVEAMPEDGKTLVIGTARSIKKSDVLVEADSWTMPGAAETLTRREVCQGLLTKRIGTIAVAKLAPRTLYEAHRFPEGVRYEELRTIGSFVGGVESYRLVREPIYGYVMRSGSIVWASKPTLKQVDEYLEAIDISSTALGALSSDLDSECAFYRAVMFTRVHDLINRGLESQEEQKRLELQVRRAVRDSLPKAIRAQGGSAGQKIRVALYATVPDVYDRAMNIYNRKVKGI